MAKKATKKKKNPGKHKKASVRPIVVKFNPGGHAKPKHKPKHKKNPIGRPGLNSRWVLNTATVMATSAALAYGGMLATREIPQMLLGSGNTGNKGLLANIGAGLGITALAAIISPRSAIAVGTGAALGIAQRYMSERLMPVAAVANSETAGIGDVFTIAAAKDSRVLIPVGHPEARRFTAPPQQNHRQLRTMAA